VKRNIKTYGNYFLKFYSGIDKVLQDKIDYVFELIKSFDVIPKRFFQHLEGAEGLFEIRIEYAINIYRIFCFFDEGNHVILINAFQKKTQKTPKQELELAKKLKKQYFIDKEIDDENGNKKKVKK
jgi:phage-related protein